MHLINRSGSRTYPCDTARQLVRVWIINIPKCVHLPITNQTKPRLHSYSLCGVPLSTVSSHSYLGVKLDTKLAWSNHITDIASKSSKVSGMIKRTLGPCKPDVKETSYNILVRPKLEYASPILKRHSTVQPDLPKTTIDAKQSQQT